MPNEKQNSDKPRLTSKQEAMLRRQAARRRNQTIVLGGITLVAVAAIALIVFAINQPYKFDSLPNPTAQIVDNTYPLNAGLIPVDETLTKGATIAKVVVTEYADFQCPACRIFFETTEKDLANDYVKTGKVKVVFASYAFLDTGSAAGRTFQESHLAAEAAYCASDQKRFWDFHDALYTNQPAGENTGKLTINLMKQLAGQLGLNKETFNKCMDDRKYKNTVVEDAQKAVQKGVKGTPTIAINGELLSGITYSEIRTAIEKALTAS
ncbi:MAG: thioredoxin domain-containing protein [Chloroflexota bacterium]|nr:DsbA family protein [Chloroflexota bacterium]